MFKKELIRDTEVTTKVVTTHSTKVEDVFEQGDIILAVNRNDKDSCGLVHRRYEYDTDTDRWEAKLTVISPAFSEAVYCRNVFDSLWELQGFYDLVVFDDFANLHQYMQDNKLEWGK